MNTSETNSITKFIVDRRGPLLFPERYTDTKDPCPVFDGELWHMYGSGTCRETFRLHVLHATSSLLMGPWIEHEPVVIDGVHGGCVAAPGVVYDDLDKKFHMFIQTEFAAIGGKIEYLTSNDGYNFEHISTALESVLDSEEACIYDSHPTEIQGKKYLTYSASSHVGKPDIYLARSLTNLWSGPWIREGVIVRHKDISHHNQLAFDDYEWGLEGSQILELPGGIILLNAVCFLPEGNRGTRQRIFFALSKNIPGPYMTIGPVLEPVGEGWESGENGHGAVVIDNEKLRLFYQSRASLPGDDHWSLGIATLTLNDIFKCAEKIVFEN